MNETDKAIVEAALSGVAIRVHFTPAGTLGYPIDMLFIEATHHEGKPPMATVTGIDPRREESLAPLIQELSRRAKLGSA